ncbi:MAG: hypothetical protein LBQ12_13970 [Deltaproteobacteria bacterium]|nr:hypothetical protein [Deltaproteobacteria bacterium]
MAEEPDSYAAEPVEEALVLPEALVPPVPPVPVLPPVLEAAPPMPEEHVLDSPAAAEAAIVLPEAPAPASYAVPPVQEAAPTIQAEPALCAPEAAGAAAAQPDAFVQPDAPAPAAYAVPPVQEAAPTIQAEPAPCEPEAAIVQPEASVQPDAFVPPEAPAPAAYAVPPVQEAAPPVQAEPAPCEPEAAGSAPAQPEAFVPPEAPASPQPVAGQDSAQPQEAGPDSLPPEQPSPPAEPAPRADYGDPETFIESAYDAVRAEAIARVTEKIMAMKDTQLKALSPKLIEAICAADAEGPPPRDQPDGLQGKCGGLLGGLFCSSLPGEDSISFAAKTGRVPATIKDIDSLVSDMDSAGNMRGVLLTPRGLEPSAEKHMAQYAGMLSCPGAKEIAEAMYLCGLGFGVDRKVEFKDADLDFFVGIDGQSH